MTKAPSKTSLFYQKERNWTILFGLKIVKTEKSTWERIDIKKDNGLMISYCWCSLCASSTMFPKTIASLLKPSFLQQSEKLISEEYLAWDLYSIPFKMHEPYRFKMSSFLALCLELSWSKVQISLIGTKCQLFLLIQINCVQIIPTGFKRFVLILPVPKFHKSANHFKRN